MMLHRAPLPGTVVTPVTSESCTFEAWSCCSQAPPFSQERQTALLMDFSLLIIDTKRVSSLSDLHGRATLLCWMSSENGPRRGHTFVSHQPVDTRQDALFVK